MRPSSKAVTNLISVNSTKIMLVIVSVSSTRTHVYAQQQGGSATSGPATDGAATVHLSFGRYCQWRSRASKD